MISVWYIPFYIFLGSCITRFSLTMYEHKTNPVVSDMVVVIANVVAMFLSWGICIVLNWRKGRTWRGKERKCT